jgi:hypothetical protein
MAGEQPLDGLLRTSAKSALCEFKSAEMLHPALMSAMRVAGAAFEYPRERQQWAESAVKGYQISKRCYANSLGAPHIRILD